MRFLPSSTPLVLAIATALTAPAVRAQVTGVSSSLIEGLSGGCLAGLSSLLTNQDLNECLKITSAITELGALQANDSIVPALGEYAEDDWCEADACSESTLQSANQTITTACSSDIENNTSFLPQLLVFVMTHYVPTKQASCLEDTRADDELCIEQTLRALERNLGQNLTLSRVSELSKDPEGIQGVLNRFAGNQTAFCTDCTQGILASLGPAIQSTSTDQQLQGTIAQSCGQDFLTGGVPSTLKQEAELDGAGTGTNSSSPGSNSGQTGASGDNGALGVAAPIGLTMVAALAAVAVGTVSLF